ncbi:MULTISPECIES: protein-L-isoaspartate O-methyltransferase [Methylobacterium]|jgi:protein-L-isoaspartate(D-aspartate) O-methyltransferase|uniref:Protein-L-isoaspartate O-methyltransferase n=3 Tax=Methylobacterium TaxID=407 RepID=A0AAE8HSV9_9HYPH|nr:MULTISPECIES: protein-L-isoaspartate O-methyltransferase [Methylobacterium]KOX42963.1 protein-L-isoaspartate O-methyltransferase [Streptomyces purpurogeneiscleroticus]AIQ93781.1 Protein-L-isoaspartate O-methyltransferase [Methylobacterium oryzae CBMB20]APT34040.1 protein-L-isoaspartate O-methyltransferase 1 [Methylobacterium phyllosphaerae]AWV14662.1 protein-L-isoaspartate O-methyltransferase [Methylobacterium sp. XJLW]MBA9060837.1 protein-L-isoaspartate(D-aspartate) O-methyltransferase [Me
MIDYAQARRMMVDCQLRTFDVNDNTVLDAFDTVPREDFVPKGREPFAYIDQTLSLGEAGGETRCMPAPMVVARMIQALRIRPGVAALDVATGTGYAAAVMAQLGAQVTALESVPDLAEAARTRLGASAQVIEGPIAAGAPKQGPFDVILINGRVEVRPQALLNQLKDDGRLVCVFGPHRNAKVTLFVRAGDAFGARPLFDASLPGLEAFAAEAGFAF